jgi:hypothetical protein
MTSVPSSSASATLSATSTSTPDSIEAAVETKKCERKFNPLTLTIYAECRQATKELVIILLGPRDIRDSVCWWEICLAPRHFSYNTMIKNAAPLDPQQWPDEEWNATRVVKPLTLYSGSSWICPLDEKKCPIPCDWVHLLPNTDTFIPIGYDDSFRGWVVVHDVLVAPLISDISSSDTMTVT